MRKISWLKLAVLLIGFLVCVPLHAVDKADWNNLKQLVAGQEVRVLLNDGSSHQGSFQSQNDEAIVIRSTTGEQALPKSEVRKVSVKGRSRRGRNAAVGVAVVGGAGAAFGALVDSAFSTYPKGTAAFAGIGAGVGAIVGAVIPTGRWHEVFRAEKRRA